MFKHNVLLKCSKADILLNLTFGNTVNTIYELCIFLVLTIFNEGAYLTFKSIFNKGLKLVKFDCEITLESFPGTHQY